jgi:molecular chaperone GrpE
MMWFITAGVVKKFLPHIDNLERALATKQWDESDNWVNGIRSIVWGFGKTLLDMNVTSFESLGQEVDAHKHEVMSQTKGEQWKIVFEFEKGYTLNDKVLRHAKVVTGNWEQETNA